MTPLEQCLAAYAAGEVPARDIEKAAVKETLARLTDAVPGNSVEVRIPPYAAVQILPGAKHRRGTPPAVVEADARTWLLLAAGEQLVGGEDEEAAEEHDQRVELVDEHQPSADEDAPQDHGACRGTQQRGGGRA